MGVYTLRPYVATGDWLNFGSGSVADDSDATFKYFTNSYQYGTVRFSTSPIPWGTNNVVIKSIKVRARVASATGVGAYLQVTASTGPTGRILISIGDSYQYYVNGVSFLEVSTGQRIVQLFPTDGDVVVNLHPTSPVDVTNQPEVSEIYLDVEFVYPPLATVNTPAGTYTTTSAPPLWFSYFSQDSYPQTAYRYLIYRDDQYTAAGFVPGTTPADYDSGIVYSTANRFNLHPRPNDTYRVYVSVAQTVNGILQWSLWLGTTNFSTYTINITPPAAPTVVATADNINARIQLAVTGAGAANSVQDVYQLERSFDGGVTWETVRSDQDGGFLEAVGGARVWFDYETANGQAVVYHARTITYDTLGNTLIGAFGSNSGSTSWASSSTWLKVVTRPDLNRVIMIQELGNETFDVSQGVFQGQGSGKAITISGVRREKPDSEVVLLAQTAAERAALQAILALGEDLLFHGSARVEDWYGDNKYLSIGKVTMSRIIRGAWQADRSMALSYTEVDRPDPSAYLVEFGVTTWQDIDDAFASFTALSAAYTTYGAIRT